MTTDYRALCAELFAAIQLYTGQNPAAADIPSNQLVGQLMNAMAATAAALAQPEPEASCTEDEAIVAYDSAYRKSAGMEHTGFGAASCYTEHHREGIRAVLQRWGRPAPPPADELLQAYQAGRRDAEADAQQAAEAAQEPPAEGEGRDLAVLLSVGADCAGGARLTSAQCRRAADLLTHLALQPVPISERLPGPEDCLEEGWAWFFNPRTGWHRATQPVRYRRPTYTHWLPAHALPLPTTTTSENGFDHG